MKTLIGTPDPDVNLKARREWVASTLRLPLLLVLQGMRKVVRRSE